MWRKHMERVSNIKNKCKPIAGFTRITAVKMKLCVVKVSNGPIDRIEKLVWTSKDIQKMENLSDYVRK